MQETWVASLDWEDPLEEGMATHSSILACKIPRTEEPGRLQSMGSQRVGNNLVMKRQQQINEEPSIFSFLFYHSVRIVPLWSTHHSSHFQMRKVRLREVVSLVQGHTGREWQSWGFNPCLLESEAYTCYMVPSASLFGGWKTRNPTGPQGGRAPVWKGLPLMKAIEKQASSLFACNRGSAKLIIFLWTS